MKDGIISGLIPIHCPYAWPIQHAAERLDSSAFLAYSIASVETIDGELAGLWNAATVVSPDGGHGLFQLTASFPDNWQTPLANALWAIDTFINPSWIYWSNVSSVFRGDNLVRAVAAEFNAGRNNAIAGHAHGEIGRYTTKSDGVTYDYRVLDRYHKLLLTGHK